MLPKVKVVSTTTCRKCIEEIRNPIARKAIDRRLQSFQTGNLGDCEPCGDSIIEARIHVGAGYRIYILPQGSELIILLCAGDKSSQKRDIVKAKKIAANL